MRRYPFAVVDVFTDRPFAGNQLAVVFDADDLSAAAMQALAREFNFAESTFVQAAAPGSGHDARVRIFTPMAELPFAGHPTVGTALALAWRGLVPAGRSRVTLGEGAGPVPVDLAFDADGRAVAAEFAAPKEPSIGAGVEPAAVAAALGLRPEQLVTAAGLPRDASCGLPFLFVELADLDALSTARLREAPAFPGSAGEGVHVFTRDTGDRADIDLRARMFSPGHGIPEDPATGSAAAALAGLLASAEAPGDGIVRYRILQGAEMGRPSRIDASARVEGGRVVEVRVGGAAVPVAEGEIAAPPG